MRFTYRERNWFFGLIFFVIAWGLFVFAIGPALARVEVLTRVLPEKTEALRDIKVKSQRYLALLSVLEDFKAKVNAPAKAFELLTVLESTVSRQGLTGKVTTIKQKVSPLNSDYTEIVVEVGLENITLDEMVKLLIKMRSSEYFLQIKSLYTKKSTTIANRLDTVMQISTFKSN